MFVSAGSTYREVISLWSTQTGATRQTLDFRRSKTAHLLSKPRGCCGVETHDCLDLLDRRPEFPRSRATSYNLAGSATSDRCCGRAVTQRIRPADVRA